MPTRVRTNDDREAERRYDYEESLKIKVLPPHAQYRNRNRRAVYPDLLVVPAERGRATSPGAATPKTTLLKEARAVDKLARLVASPETCGLPARLPRSRQEALGLNAILDSLSAAVRRELVGYDTCAATLLHSSASPATALQQDLLAQQVAARASRDSGSEQEALTEALDTILADLIRGASKKSKRLNDLHQRQLRAVEEDSALRFSALQEAHATELAILRDRISVLEAELTIK